MPYVIDIEGLYNELCIKLLLSNLAIKSQFPKQRFDRHANKFKLIQNVQNVELKTILYFNHKNTFTRQGEEWQSKLKCHF